MKWTLIKQTSDGAFNKHRKCNETVFHYQSGNETVAFYSHPTRAWAHVLVSGNKKYFIPVLDAFTNQALKQNEYPGGFDEAIKTLTT